MANNCLYILDTTTGEKYLIAKSWGGWECDIDNIGLNKWLGERNDFGASTLHGKSILKLVTDDE